MQPTKSRFRVLGRSRAVLMCVCAVALLLILYARESTSIAIDLRAEASKTLDTSAAVDQQPSEARHLVDTAGLLTAKWNEVSLRQAIVTYDKAVALFSANGVLSEAAYATLKSGDVCFVLSDFDEALKRYEKAVTLARSCLLYTSPSPRDRG